MEADIPAESSLQVTVASADILIVTSEEIQSQNYPDKLGILRGLEPGLDSEGPKGVIISLIYTGIF